MPRIGVGLGLGLFQGSSFDASYQAVLDYATSLGYTLPSSAQQVKQNKLIVDLKAGGVWNKLDTLRVYATDGSSNFALIDWKRLSLCTAVNSPTFTTNQGFTSNGTSSYLDVNFTPSINSVNASQNNLSIGFWEYSTTSGTTGVLCGIDDSIRDILVTQRQTSSDGRLRMNDSVTLLIPASNYSSGFVLGQRINTTREFYSPNGTLTTDTLVSNATATLSIRDLNFGSTYSLTPISLGFLGASFSSTQVTNFRTAVTNYITSL